MKPIAFYLPQYHEIPENDLWWGKGFTEWTNVKNAKPLFDGHKQPIIPLNGNYYNLLDLHTFEWQIRIAEQYGLYGFCFYHYWFDGKLMLERPLELYLDNPQLDFPFCLCWANPPWTKVWAGRGSDVLIDQKYDEKNWDDHFQYLLQFFKDKRYIREDNKPILIIYEPDRIPCIEKLTSFFRKKAAEAGLPGIKLVYQNYVDPKTDLHISPLFDYRIEFQPIYGLNVLEKHTVLGLIKKYIKKISKKTNIGFGDYLKKIRMTDYDQLWNTIINSPPIDEKSLPGAFVKWDNTPRRGLSGRIINNATPDKFEKYMSIQLARAKEIYNTDYIFITAWNEWSEGSFLEPDENDKYNYLEALKNAVDSVS